MYLIGIIPSLFSSLLLFRRQQEAVSAISYLCASPLFPSAPPYIIFGPPGTGKTITLIEIIREVFQQNRSVKILACAPSDAAADVLCLRLAKYFSTTQLFRLNWWQRLIASVPIEILNYCHLHNENCFDLPPYEVLNRFNIIVTTTVTCGFLNCCPLPLVFDLILIDEVSQATEAETFVPISLCSPNGIVVLAGDPEQLGPSVRSPAYHLKGLVLVCYQLSLLISFFLCLGMSKSLIEKLLKQQLYQDVRPDVHEVLLESPNKSFLFSKFGTYLTLNYRSQKSIISLPSQLFYKNSLQEGQDRQQLDSLGSWKYLNNAKLLDDDEENNENRPFVVLFKGVDGRHRHEIDSPAFYNIEEISAVVEICSSLIFEYGKELQISTKDIGVIGAFRSQVLKLRLALRAAQLGGINVGSVEDFQGQETRIIIISTVLTHRIPHLEMNGSLGLLGDHRKFNVSLTRGMHLAIIVGHPYCLHTDPNWRQLMNYCDRHGTYTGYSCTLLDRVQDEINQENELLNSIARISLLGNTSTSSSDSWNTTSKNGGNQYFPETLEWRGLL